MTASLAFSAGCLLFTSLYRLLPEALLFLKSSQGTHSNKWTQSHLMASYVGGVLVCVVMNWLLHVLTSESVVHCNHGGHDHDDDIHDHVNKLEDHVHHHEIHDHELHGGHSRTHGNLGTHQNNESRDNLEHHHSHITGHDHDLHNDHYHGHHHGHHHVHVHDDHHDHDDSHADTSEHTPLLPLKTKKSLLHYIVHEDSPSECKGYSSAERCEYTHANTLHFCEIPDIVEGEELTRLNTGHTSIDHDETKDHHHHVNSPLSRLLLIGVQTTMAITIHKFPEGFITFVTSETNPELGYQIFFSLLVHNVTEGFSMSLPLFYSFSARSPGFAKLKAFGISALLGGLSQPLGALGGMMLLRQSEKIDFDSLEYVYGITMAVTSGFLTVIGFSMYGLAVSFGGTQNWVLFWCVFGILVIGMSSIVAA